MSTFLTPPVWYDETGNKIDILNNKTYSSGAVSNTAIGTSAIAGKPSSEGACFGAVAVGSQAEAAAPLSIAVGSYDDDNLQPVQALGSGSIALGGGAIANANAVNGIAIGRAAAALVQGGIAIGGGTQVVMQGGIAIGQDAYVTELNVIQLGSNDAAYTLSVGDGRMSLKIGSTAQGNWVSATSNNISQGLYLVRYGAGQYINTVYLMAPIEVTDSTEGHNITNDWYFPFATDPSGIFYYLKVDKTSSASALSITPVYYNKSTSAFVTMADGASVMLFKIL